LTATLWFIHCGWVNREPIDIPAPGDGLAGRAISRLVGEQRLSAAARVAVTLVVLLLFVGAAVLTAPWGFMAFGSAIGVLFVAGVPAAQAGLRPVAALGGAALPLLLPFFVFIAAGVVKSPAELQFAVGLVTLLLAWALIRPDWQRVGDALNRQRRYRGLLRGLAQVGVPLLIALIALAFLGSSIIELLGDSDQIARTLFILAVGALAAAAVLRIVGYGRTAFRAAVALALLVVIARLAVDVGLLSAGVLDSVPTATAALIAGVVLAVTALVEVLTSVLARDAGEQSGIESDRLSPGVRTAVFLETPVAARWVTDRLSIAGVGCAVLSAALLLCAVFAASKVGGADEDLADTPRAGLPVTRPAEVADEPLAAVYSPVLVFTADQRWTPTTVDAYVGAATVTDWEGRPKRISNVHELRSECPGVVRTPCFVMRQQCTRDPAQCAQDLPDDKAVYVRVARKQDWTDCSPGEPCVDGSPNPFARAKGPYAENTEILLQYWYFYPYNEWVAPVAVGDLKEIHAADWEAVTIGLSADRPLWVAFSAHCAGTYADWSKIHVAPSDKARLRPLVAVAVGSQANYRVARQSRVPNFAECSGVTKDRLKLLSYAANIRDRTDDATTWTPDAGDLRLVDATKAPMSYPGTWAPWARMRLENLRKSIPLGADGAGPASPPLQALWQKPMNAIFGGGAWTEG
jgi:hypothetical protein